VGPYFCPRKYRIVVELSTWLVDVNSFVIVTSAHILRTRRAQCIQWTQGLSYRLSCHFPSNTRCSVLILYARGDQPVRDQEPDFLLCYRKELHHRPEAQPEWGRRGHAPPLRKNLLRFFASVLYQFQLFKNKRKEQSGSCSVVFSHWPRFNVTFCDWMRNNTSKAYNFVSKVAN